MDADIMQLSSVRRVAWKFQSNFTRINLMNISICSVNWPTIDLF